jgi:hypothetical protein
MKREIETTSGEFDALQIFRDAADISKLEIFKLSCNGVSLVFATRKWVEHAEECGVITFPRPWPRVLPRITETRGLHVSGTGYPEIPEGWVRMADDFDVRAAVSAVRKAERKIHHVVVVGVKRPPRRKKEEF